ETPALQHRPIITVRNIFLISGIIFVAFNLRPTITSVGPLIHVIREDMNLSNGWAGLLTTLPLITFAILSPLAPKLSHRWGNAWTIMAGLGVLLIGIYIRSEGLMIGLFAGTA